MPYSIGSLVFSSKKKSSDYVRRILTKLGCCKIRQGHEYYGFFIDLLQNHCDLANKIGTGILYVRIKKNPLNRRAYETHIMRTDHTSVCFSWKCCAEHTGYSYKYELTSALRFAIGSQIKHHLMNNKRKCNMCGTKSAMFEVDHISTFLKLSTDFMNTCVHPCPRSFNKDKDTNQYAFKKSAHKFRKQWQWYHKTNAELQILCHRCHKKKHLKIIRVY